LHDAAGRDAAFWQPHLHWLPVQDSHVHAFDWVALRVVMISSFQMLTSCQRKGVSHPGRQSGLDEAAIVQERIGYFVDRWAWRGPPSVNGELNGEAISVNSPRINADGAIQT